MKVTRKKADHAEMKAEYIIREGKIPHTLKVR
jgi:hypothetical protein